jgi:tRNA (cytidine/uridine-2'-O-)-methyltransferase
LPEKSTNPNFNIVLVEPEIPNNTGAIGRTCVGTNCRLHLVGRLGFDISDKAVKRAGLDYWDHLDLKQHKNLNEMLTSQELVDGSADQVSIDKSRIFYFTKNARLSLFDVQFQKGDWFVFGKETTGLDDALLREVEVQTVRIPLWGQIRSLNLSNAVSVVIYEGMRQVIASSKIPR